MAKQSGYDEDDAPEPVPPPSYEGLSLLDLLSRAQRALYATLLSRLEAGTASDNDIKSLRQLLAENGLVLVKEEMARRMIDVTPRKVELPDFSAERFDE